ncbi:hypothetical protein L5D93_29005 [Paenibacillus thiaminolyticus]|nr:hypothetical protein [Paenibacillus thiaminolyticus]
MKDINYISIASSIVAIIATVITITLTYKNYKREQNKVKPKINIIFTKVFDPGSSSTKFDISLMNQSDYKLYNFKFTKTPPILFLKNNEKIGMLEYEISTFFPGQSFTSYFGDFLEYRKQKIDKLDFEYQFRINRNGKLIKEDFSINIEGFINSYRLEYKKSN